MMRSMCAHPTAERRMRKRPEITATEEPAALHAAMAARTCSGLSVDTRRAARPSEQSALALERAEIHVAGRQSWCARANVEQLADAQEGRGRRTARRSAHSAASSLRKSSASSAQPWKEKERCTVRPDSGSTPTATRISHVPGLRSRMVPVPHAMRAKVGTVGTAIPAPRRAALYPYAGLRGARSEGFEPPTF